MREEDILLWPDGFWCFRFELRDGINRDSQYRVVPYESDRWEQLGQTRAYTRGQSLGASRSHRPGRMPVDVEHGLA